MNEYTRLAFLDLDGVLCNDSHRVHFALSKAWVSYFGAIPNDTAWPQGRELYENLILCGYDIAFLTGRREDTRNNTIKSLKGLGFDTDFPLIMRKFNDRRPLGELKAEIAWQAAELYDEIVLYDDDLSVIEQVQKKLGSNAAIHCTWYEKPKKMIRTARF